MISACAERFDIRRAQDWTTALNAWCASQPGLVAYRGECLVHRAEILRLHGLWPEAISEAEQAFSALLPSRRHVKGAAAYEVGELRRLRGELDNAEAAYRQASELGRNPHPGLALLRLAQGQRELARAAIARVLSEQTPRRQRAEALAAAVEIYNACDDAAAARSAANELAAIRNAIDLPWITAIASQAEGAVRLAEGLPQSALQPLRETSRSGASSARRGKRRAPRFSSGRPAASSATSTALQLETDAAISTLRSLGAVSDSARLEPAAGSVPSSTGLSSRELEVLRLIAKGQTNRAIAGALGISEKTVARHVSNIFVKLDLATRAAATAYAFTHGLVSS